MDTLHITLFGHVTVVHPNNAAQMKLSRGLQSLLAYLLLQQHLVPREVLLEVFWADDPPERARSNLTTALWRLRQLLEPQGVPSGTYLLTSNASEVGFNWQSRHWLDTESFEQYIYPFLRKSLSALSEDDIERIEGVLPLYRGELLEGIYEDWALRERERFRLLYLNCVTRLMDFYAGRNNFEQSSAYGHEILRRDPLREEIHRNLMRIYLANGQRTLATRQYEQCRDLLLRELGIPPLEETERLYQQIVASSPARSLTIGQPPSQEITQLAYELHLVKHSLDEATRAMARIAHSMSHITGQVAPGNAGKQKR